MGIEWASTLIGLIMLLFTPAPFLFLKYGARIRIRSSFAPGIVCRRSLFCCVRAEAVPFIGPEDRKADGAAEAREGYCSSFRGRLNNERKIDNTPSPVP